MVFSVHSNSFAIFVPYNDNTDFFEIVFYKIISDQPEFQFLTDRQASSLTYGTADRNQNNEKQAAKFKNFEPIQQSISLSKTQGFALYESVVMRQA